MSINADLLLLGATILTGADTVNVTDAVAIKNGRIVAVGKQSEMSQLQAKQKIHLDGKVIVPGFIDAHNHLSLYSVLLQYLDCRTSLNGEIDEVLERIEEKAKKTPPGEWIRGWGYADYKMKQRRFPTLEEMDAISPNNPTAIIHISGHSVIVNSQALKETGIDENTPDPVGGQIERDINTGKLNGVLHETAMQNYSFESIFMEFLMMDQESQMEIIRKGTHDYAKIGITSAWDAAAVPQLLAAYQEAERRGNLGCRVTAAPLYDLCKEAVDSGILCNFGSDWFKTGAIKLLGDGSLSGRTAAVSIPYQGTENTGILYRNQDELDKLVKTLDEKGLQIAIHAIGDVAVDQVLSAYEKVIKKGGQNKRRHRMEHAGILNQELIQRMVDVDLVIATQPRMLFEQGDGFYRSCGDDRVQMLYPYRSLIENGLHVGGSSDCPVVSADPVLGMQNAVLRKTEEGRVLAPGQCLEPEQALQMFTQGSAYTCFEENERGTIENDKLADMVVLSSNPLNTPAENWDSAVKVEMTIVGGKIVFKSE